MKSENNNFRMGLRDGVAIGIGYLAVSFAFGIFATSSGLSVIEAVLISMFNLTSAGQIAGLPIIASGGSLLELALTQLVINSRYALMSVSLSQRLSEKVSLADRFLISFANTDEIFAVACGKEARLGRKYFYGLVIAPFLGWTLGTLFGGIAGDILPELIVTSLSVAMYAMFIAIVVPAAKMSKSMALCIVTAVILSSVFYFTPVLNQTPSGFVIVICAVLVSLLFATVAPIENEENGEVAEND